MRDNTDIFWNKVVNDINKKENRNGQLIISPHWYSIACLLFIIGSVVVAFLLREQVPVIYFVGFFPVYILAIIFSFESKSVYVKNSDNLLNHKILRSHLTSFYQTLNKEEKEKFREVIITQKEITYGDLLKIKNS